MKHWIDHIRSTSYTTYEALNILHMKHWETSDIDSTNLILILHFLKFWWDSRQIQKNDTDFAYNDNILTFISWFVIASITIFTMSNEWIFSLFATFLSQTILRIFRFSWSFTLFFISFLMTSFWLFMLIVVCTSCVSIAKIHCNIVMSLHSVEIVSRSFNQRNSELICMYCSLEIAITRH